MYTRGKAAVSTIVTSVVVIVALIVGVGAGYFAGTAGASGGTITTTSAATTTVTSTVQGAGGGGASTSVVTSTQTVTATGSGAATGPTDLVSLAKAEGGTLTVYSIDDANTYQTYMLPNITKTYPWLKVNFVGLDGPSTISRPTSELKAGKVQADVVEIGNLGRTTTDVNNGVCASVDLSNHLLQSGYPPSAFDSAGHWYALSISPYVIFYNTNLVSPSQVPKSYADLANPIWKGKIAMDRPQALGGAGLVLASMYPTLGNASWTQLVKNIAANQPALQTSGGTVETLVTQGQYAIGIDVTNGPLTSIKQGLPVKIAWTSPVYTGISAMCITAGAPHPYTAQLYTEWETSLAGQITLTKGYGFLSPIAAVSSYTLQGVIPNNVTFSADITKTTFYSSPSTWSNLYTSMFGP